MLGLASAITPSAAISSALRIALSMPPVSNDTAEPGRGQPSGTWWVTTITGTPIGCWPPQPLAVLKVRRPATMTWSPAAPGSDGPSAGWEAGCGVVDPGDPRSTPASGSGTEPSIDIDIAATTVAIRIPLACPG